MKACGVRAVADSRVMRMCFLLLCAWAPCAAAHSLSVAYLHVEQDPGSNVANLTLDAALAGQLAVVAAALPIIHALSGWRHYVRWLMNPLSLLIASLGG